MRSRGIELVVGLGFRVGVSTEHIIAAVREAVGDGVVVILATIDRRVTEPGLCDAAAHFGVPVLGYSAAELAAVPVPNPSERVGSAVGTGSVAEAAALLAGGGPLLTAKRVVDGVTVATARRIRLDPGD